MEDILPKNNEYDPNLPVIEQVTDSLYTAGWEHVPPNPRIGVIESFPGRGKPLGNTSARICKLSEAHGWYQDHSIHSEPIYWDASTGKGFAVDSEQAEKADIARQQADSERHANQTAAAEKSRNIWQHAPLADESHPYLSRKQIKPYGAKLSHDGALIYPVLKGRKVVSLQFIYPDGSKRFLKSGEKKGGYWSIGDLTKTIILAEGVATGASLHEVTGLHVIVAFDAGNLKAVALVIREMFPDAQIIICGDNDQSKTGETKGRAAAAAVNGAFIMPPNVGMDFNDAISSGGLTPEMVNAMIADAKPAKTPFKLTTCADLMQREFKPSWLISGLIEQGSLGLMFGNPASGKSLIVQDICHCIATGRDFKGKPVKKGKVVCIAGEGFSGLQKRLAALAAHYGEQAQNLYLSEQPAAFMEEKSAVAVAEAINQIGGAVLVVIDTLHRNFGSGDENSAKDLATFLGNIDKHLMPLGATVLIIHHSGHGDKERSRGSSALRASVDVEYSVTKDGDFVTLKNTKMKDFAPPDPLTFKMQPIETGKFYEDGALVTSVILELTDEKPTKELKLTVNEDKVLECLKRLMISRWLPAPASLKDKIPEKTVDVTVWRGDAYQIIEGTQAAKRMAFKRCLTKLEDAKLVATYSGYAWIL